MPANVNEFEYILNSPFPLTPKSLVTYIDATKPIIVFKICDNNVTDMFLLIDKRIFFIFYSTCVWLKTNELWNSSQ